MILFCEQQNCGAKVPGILWQLWVRTFWMMFPSQTPVFSHSNSPKRSFLSTDARHIQFQSEPPYIIGRINKHKWLGEHLWYADAARKPRILFSYTSVFPYANLRTPLLQRIRHLSNPLISTVPIFRDAQAHTIRTSSGW